ncbi:DUF1947 domain-containing protein [Candidatus Woesearchaeota archaeon]|nr:DUF1947 domain-containing protein [Candidatus Woesearchaeota archaeon]
MKRTQLRSKDVSRELMLYDVEFSKKDSVELCEDELTLLAVNKLPAFFRYGERWIPTLKFLQQRMVLKRVVVDMGAIKFLIGGADVMRPGIVEIDEMIIKDEPVAIVDMNNKKPIAVGIALVSGSEMKETKSGKVIHNIHYVGDKIWNMS